jgi:hypothetical protein
MCSLLERLKAENSLLGASDVAYREQVAKGLERIVEIVKEIRR